MNWKLIAFACAMSATVALAADEIAEKLFSAGAQVTRGEGLYRFPTIRLRRSSGAGGTASRRRRMRG